jgi:sugar diacid utilization regulator/GAF domain-containing protein
VAEQDVAVMATRDPIVALVGAIAELCGAETSADVDDVLDTARDRLAGSPIADVMYTLAEIARDRVHARAAAAAARAEVSAVQTVAGQVLLIRDVEQVLLSVANTVLRLLDADICGVLLVEGDALVMRSCVGHRAAETAGLRMKAGQGLAGRVLEVGTPWKVERYLEADDISHDFMSLAAKEEARAALGVPLRNDTTVMGVLEVWRRRELAFSDDDVVLLTTLADLVSIAIVNADLYDAQCAAVERTTEALHDLETQHAHLRRSTSLQRELVHSIVLGTDRRTLAQVIGEELRCSVVILSPRGDHLAMHPEQLSPPTLPTASLLRDAGGDTSVVRLRVGGTHEPAYGQQVRAGQTVLGAICLLGCSETEEVVELVLGQAASAYALHNLSERAASTARATVRDEIVWDLVDGDRRQRAAALDRADRHAIDLQGPVWVLHGELRVGDDAEYDPATSSARTRRRLREQVHQVVNQHPDHLGSCRGDWVVVITRSDDRSWIGAIAGEIGQAISTVRTEVDIRWGVSAPCQEPVELPTAFRQAKTAVRAAAVSRRDRPMHFDDLGTIRVLFAEDGGTDVRAFIDDTLGPLLAYDAERDGALLATLRAYFAADCSQKDAAQLIPVHHKTLRYRLDKIEELTGLDLTRHSERLRASIALDLLGLREV